MLKKIAVLVCTFVCVFFLQGHSFGQTTTTFPSGSAIIDMGSSSPTVKNSLKPYGLIYALLKNNHVPVSYVVNSAKVKDGIDFVYNGKSYKGGTFVISSDYISSAVTTVLNSWSNQGVLIDYTTSDLTVTVTQKINFAPKWVMDKTNGAIAVSFLTAAGIPSSAYVFKTPAQLAGCDDIFVLPHADPTWATHSNLYDWVRTNGILWAGCHAASVLESMVDNALAPTKRTNFLTSAGLIPFTDHNPASTPFSNLLPGDPVAQYLGKTDNAQLNGSETVYLPKVGSIWNTGSKILTGSPNQPDVPTLSAGAAVENIYGRAFDNAAFGYVAYQASHNIGGTTPDNIAAQRIFFNFSLFALNDRVPPIITANLSGQPVMLEAGTTSGILNGTATGSGTGFTYQWTASVAGVFSAPTSATTTFTPSAGITSATDCILTCVVTESCGRVSFESKKIKVIPPTAGHPLTNINITKNIPDGCSNASITFNVFDGNPDPDAGTRTLLSVTGLGNGSVITNTNGDITFTASANFKGATNGTFIITNGIINSPAGNITITVGDATLAPVVTADAVTAMVDAVTPVNVLANDLNKTGAANGGELYIRDIITKPTKGNVYINTNGTLSYLSNKDQATVGSDAFEYLACNTVGYCTVGTVNVTLIQDVCAAGSYQITTTGTAASASFSATADTYLSAVAGTTNTNFGSATAFQVHGLNQRNGLVKFNVSSIPTNATVVSAAVSLTTSANFTPTASTLYLPLTFYSSLKPWVEAEATWITVSTAGGPWTTTGSVGSMGAGIDYSNTRSANTGATGTTPSVLVPLNTVLTSGDMSAMVQDWVTTSANNNGLLVLPTSNSGNGAAVQFYSKENAANRAPRLTVNYTTPACFTIPTNYTPIVYPDATTTSSALSVTISPLTNDVNYYGNANALQSVTVPAHGTATINGNNVIYTPNGSFIGIDTLTYTVADGAQTNTATIRVTVTRVGPKIVDDIATTPSNTAKTIVVGANDSDPQGTISAPTITTQAKNGTLTVVGNDIVYTPSTNFVGTDVFRYTRSGSATDVCSVALTGTATVTVTVTNQTPVANPGVINTFACVTGNIAVATVGTDPESGALSATIASAPANGTVVANSEGKMVYTPTPNFVGTDAFTYTVTDPLGATSAAATISITVSGAANPNIAPVAVNDADNTLVNQPVYTNVLINDSDPNTDPLSISITALGLNGPLSGTIALMPNKLVKYTPNNNFTGTDTYQYKITDTHAGCAPTASLTAIATVTITVKAIPTGISGTVWNDVDQSAAPGGVQSFTNIKTNTETGTNGNGSVYVYVVDNTNTILDRTPVDIDGTYLLSNVPSLTSNLTLVLSSEDLAVGATLTTGSVPSGYVNTTPLTRSLPTTTSTDMAPYDWGIYTNTTLFPGTIAGGSNICGTSGTPATLTSTANATGGSVTATGYVYIWQSSTLSASAGFADIAGATATSYTPGAAITTTTYYRRKVSTNLNTAVFSNVVTVLVSANPTVAITPVTGTIASGSNILLTANGANTYSWTPATGLSATNTAAVTASPLATTMYTVTGTATPSGCVNTASITVTVINPGTIGTDQAACGSFTPAALTSVVNASEASGTAVITYQWQSSITSAVAGFSDIAAATAAAYTPAGAITTTTYYRRIATSGVVSVNSNVVTATVNVAPAVAVAPTGITIQKGFSQTFTASGATTYAWTPATGLSATNTATVVATPAATTTYTVTGTTAGCNNTSNVLVTVIDPGTIGTDQANCGTYLPAPLTSTTAASGTGTITYQWQSSTTSSTTGFANIGGATATAYTPAAAITTTTYFRRMATGAGQTYSSNVITATVNAIPVVAIAPTSATIALGLTQTFSASGANTYVWSPATGLSSTTGASVTVTPAATGTVNYTVTGTITASGCTGTGNVSLTTVPVGGLIPGTIGSPQTICSAATPGAFTSTAASGGTGTINYQWQSSTDNITFSNITGATAATYAAPSLTQTTYYRRSASTSLDAAVFTASVKVTVLAKPVITGGINGPCAMPRDTVKTFSVTAAPNATNYVWTLPGTGGWSGTSTTNTINVKAGATNGTISVTPFNGTCAGAPVNYTVSIIDYAKVTISGTPVTASGNNNNPVKVTIQLYDITGSIINCSGGPATLCTNSGTFTTVVDNGDGTYTSFLTSSANDVTICGAVAGVQISQTTKVTFTGPQGGIKSNGPILDFETPKITFTATAGRAPFTVIYHSAKSAQGKNDTLTNVSSGVAYGVKLIPSTTLYTLVSVIDANGERRDNNFIRDTTTTIVLAPKVIITLKSDTPKKEADSTWATRIVVHTKNIGDMDLTNSQARLNLKDVFPSPVTYVLDSVKVSGTTVVPNRNYDGISSTDLFAKLSKGRRDINTTTSISNLSGMSEAAAPDGSNAVQMWSNTDQGDEPLTVIEDGHSVYMFGAQSSLPVGMDATIILWLHVKPNGYTEPFVMQAVALGTGSTEGATALTTSLSNDNEDVNAHPEVTKTGDPLPAIINLFPTAVIGASLAAGTPALQGNGTYNVTLSYRIKNYGNVNLKNVQLSQNLLRSIGAPSTFNVVSPVTSTGNLIPNPGFNAKSDTNMLLPTNSILGYKQESSLSFTINITPNQLASIYRLQATATGFSNDLNTTVTDLSNDGTEPDTDGNNIPSEKVITTIIINLPVPPLVPGNIGIKTGPTTTVAAKGYCASANAVEIIPISTNTGGLDAYLYQWQSSADNVSFKDIIGAESDTYTTGLVSTSTYLRRATISGSQVKYSNSVYIQIYPAPPVPTITGTATIVVGKGNITLTSPLATSYAWSTGATTRSIFVQDAGSYGLTITDANGCTAVATAYAITALDPGKVADVQKILSKAPALQQDGSFLLSFNILASNLRTEILDSVKLKDDLSKVFPASAVFTIVDIKASGALIANSSYDGKSQIDLLNDVSKLAASKTDSVQITIKVFPNGFAGTLNNVVNLTARSPFGTVAVASNDPINNGNPAIRLPTKFVLPFVDIFIPSGFSPNRDGINDLFVITRPFNTTINLEIFNRWSNLVYKSPDYKNEWDGKGNQANRIMGEDLPDGTYYYVVVATDKTTGSIRKFAGYVTLKR